MVFGIDIYYRGNPYLFPETVDIVVEFSTQFIILSFLLSLLSPLLWFLRFSFVPLHRSSFYPVKVVPKVGPAMVLFIRE